MPAIDSAVQDDAAFWPRSACVSWSLGQTDVTTGKHWLTMGFISSRRSGHRRRQPSP